MKILVVSDTHGRDENFEQAVMQETPFDMLIHCGDVEGREIFIEALTECPCHIVSGNNDFFSDLPREEIVEAGNNRIFVTHGHYYGVSMDITGVIDEAKDRLLRPHPQTPSGNHRRCPSPKSRKPDLPPPKRPAAKLRHRKPRPNRSPNRRTKTPITII